MTLAMLPILTIEERKLSPSYGYVFDPKWLDPHESIVSILWKFGRMNALPGHVLATQVAKESVDPYEGWRQHARRWTSAGCALRQAYR